MNKFLIALAVLVSVNASANDTTYECASTTSDLYIEMNPLTEDSVLLDNDEYQILYDKTDGDVHYTKMRNNALKKDAFLIVQWGANNQVAQLSLVITPVNSQDVLFEGICTNTVGDDK